MPSGCPGCRRGRNEHPKAPRSMSRNHVHLHARRWAAVRRAVFERDGWRCTLSAAGRAG